MDEEDLSVGKIILENFKARGDNSLKQTNKFIYMKATKVYSYTYSPSQYEYGL